MKKKKKKKKIYIYIYIYMTVLKSSECTDISNERETCIAEKRGTVRYKSFIPGLNCENRSIWNVKKKKKKNRWSLGWSWKEWYFNGLAPKNILTPPPHRGLFCNNQSLKITGVRSVKIKIPLSRHEWNLTSLDSIGNWMFTLLTDCWSWDSHLIFWGMLLFIVFISVLNINKGPVAGEAVTVRQWSSNFTRISLENAFNLVVQLCSAYRVYVTGRPCGSVSQWSECSHGVREVLGSSPVGPCAFSFPVTFGGSLWVRARAASRKGTVSRRFQHGFEQLRRRI